MKNILMIGQFTDISGYGNASRCYLKNLIELHEEKEICLHLLNFSFEKDIKISKEELEIISSFSITDDLTVKRGNYKISDLNKIKEFIKGNYEVVFFLLNDWMISEAGINLNKICMQSSGVYPCVVWETNTVPKIWQTAYQKINLKKLICACEWNKKTFDSAGDCEVIPYSVEFENDHDPQYYNKLKKITQDKFVVSSVFQWDPRKGLEKTLLSFYLAFYDNPNAVFILKTYKNKSMGASSEAGFLSNEIKKIISKIKHQGVTVNPKCKTIILNDLLDKKQLNSIYKLSDVYLSCSRGEGFGLPIAEAINFEVPVVVPDIGGHLDFIDLNSNFLIKSSLEPVLEYENSYWSSLQNDWVEVSLNSAKEKLLESYHDKELIAKGKDSKKFMLNVLSKEICKQKFKKVLK